MKKLLILTAACFTILLTGCVDDYYTAPGVLYPDAGDGYYSDMYNGYNRDYQRPAKPKRNQPGYYSSHTGPNRGYRGMQTPPPRSGGVYHSTQTPNAKNPGYYSDQSASNIKPTIKKKKPASGYQSQVGDQTNADGTTTEPTQDNSGYSSSGSH